MHKNILITGGLGFIGSNFINYLSTKTKANIINIDKITHNFFIINSYNLNKLKNYFFYNFDISNKKKLKDLFRYHNIDLVFNFAAESHVDNSILNPEKFCNTNILGTLNLLQTSYLFWKKNKMLDNGLFFQISTDEVFGSIPHNSKKKFLETDKFFPNSPYSASKASAELLIRSFNKTFGLNTIITNSSNNFGPGQLPEKLIPKAIYNLISGKKIPIYGKGLNMRDWIYVKDNAMSIFEIYKKGSHGNSYNIGGNNCISNNSLIKKLILAFNKKFKTNINFNDATEYVEDRLGHDIKYDVNLKKINKLGIKINTRNFDRNLLSTIDWYLENINEIKKFM